jgi:hypothetical protein
MDRTQDPHPPMPIGALQHINRINPAHQLRPRIVPWPASAGGRQVLIGVHDPVFARALILDNGISKMAFITADTAAIQNGDEVMKELTAELGIPATHVSLIAAHDHNTPTFGGGGQSTNYDPAPYLALMKKGILEAAHQANAHLQPARIGRSNIFPSGNQ